MTERTTSEQLQQADDVNRMAPEERGIRIFDLIKQRDRLIWELKRAERANDNLHARLEVFYRPGLPPIEQIREHEVRGGWWMGMFTGANDTRKAPQIYRLFINERGEVRRGDDEHDTYGMPVSSTDVMRRPCMPDGTPCRWSEPTT